MKTSHPIPAQCGSPTPREQPLDGRTVDARYLVLARDGRVLVGFDEPHEANAACRRLPLAHRWIRASDGVVLGGVPSVVKDSGPASGVPHMNVISLSYGAS